MELCLHLLNSASLQIIFQYGPESRGESRGEKQWGEKQTQIVRTEDKTGVKREGVDKQWRDILYIRIVCVDTERE